MNSCCKQPIVETVFDIADGQKWDVNLIKLTHTHCTSVLM